MGKFEKKDSGCWVWSGAKGSDGYGQMTDGKGAAQKHYYAHRLAYEFFVGEILGELKVLHTCDVDLCVNPSHLYLGTNADNTRDMMKRGRARWDGAGVPKLSNAQKETLKTEVVAGASRHELAKKYQVSLATVRFHAKRALLRKSSR